jgi:hypothetical protein
MKIGDRVVHKKKPRYGEGTIVDQLPGLTWDNLRGFIVQFDLFKMHKNQTGFTTMLFENQIELVYLSKN